MLITMGILYLMTTPTTTITRLTVKSSRDIPNELLVLICRHIYHRRLSRSPSFVLLYCSSWCSWCGIGGKPLVASGTEEPVAICDPDKPCDEPVDTTA